MKKLKSVFICFLVVLGTFFLTYGAHAQQEKLSVNKATAMYLPNIQHALRSPDEFFKASNPELPVEPQFKQVRFLQEDPPKTLSERIDRLIYGIKIDIPPEYDHYGYEIRRYMKGILNPNDLNDSLHIPEMLQNARTARIILEHWKKKLTDEAKIIQAELDKSSSNHGLITAYKYNQGVINSFIPVIYIWIDNNIEFLEYIQEIGGEYYVSYPFYEVPNPNFRDKLKTLYEKRENGLKEIITYSPFSMMIY